MKCEYCNNEVPVNSAKCPSCGAAAAQPPPSTSAMGHTSAQTVFTTEEAFKAKVVRLEPYYQDEFTKIFTSNGVYNGKWNWAAFFFTWIWAFSKGMVMHGVIALVVSCVLGFTTFGLGGFAVCIYFALRGNKMYYEKIINQKDVYV